MFLVVAQNVIFYRVKKKTFCYNLNKNYSSKILITDLIKKVKDLNKIITDRLR